jgi:hypothetical protein
MTQWQNELDQARYDAVVNALASAQSDADNAQLRYQEALRIGDMYAASEAQRQMSRAEARIVSLETGKDAWDEQQTTRGNQQQQQTRPVTAQDIINSMTTLTDRERKWLSERPHLVTDQRHVTRLQDTFNLAAEKGLQRDSDEYFALFNERLAGAGGPQGMTPAMQDAAKVAGVSNDEYMRQWNKMHSERYDSASLYGVRR